MSGVALSWAIHTQKKSSEKTVAPKENQRICESELVQKDQSYSLW